MAKVLTNSNGQVYFVSGSKALLPPEVSAGGAEITGYNEHCDENGIWHFPSEEWSQTVNGTTYDDNIELIATGADEQVLYFLMDVRGEYAFCRFRVYGNPAKFTVGVCNNGTFTAISESTTVAVNAYYANWLADYHDDGYDFVVVKVESATVANPFTGAKPNSWSSDGTHTAEITAAFTPILMRYGNFPYGTYIDIGTNNTIESDNVKNFASGLTNTTLTLTSAYATSTRFARWRCDGWNIKNNKTTSIASMFYNCYQLCDTPQLTDMSGWVSSSTTSTATFMSGCSLWKNPIDVSNWNFSACTTAASIFAACYSLSSIKNTSTWTGGSLITTMASTFQNCYLLDSVDLTGMTLSNKLTTMASMFATCQRIKSIKLPALDLSNVTNLSSMFSGCWSLSELTYGTITPATTKLTTIASMFANCWRLTSVDMLKGFNLTNANISIAFSTMRSLKSSEDIDLTGISEPTASIAYGSNQNPYANNYSMSYCDYSWFDCATDSSASKYMTTTMAYGLINVVDYYPPQNLQAVNIDLSTQIRMSHDSLLRVVNALPTTATTKTFKLGTANKPKLTAAEIAIATNKGWTVT